MLNFANVRNWIGKRMKLIATDSMKHAREIDFDVLYPENVMDFASQTFPDKFKLENLLKRQNIYGDIT